MMLGTVFILNGLIKEVSYPVVRSQPNQKMLVKRRKKSSY